MLSELYPPLRNCFIRTHSRLNVKIKFDDEEKRIEISQYRNDRNEFTLVTEDARKDFQNFSKKYRLRFDKEDSLKKFKRVVADQS